MTHSTGYTSVRHDSEIEVRMVEHRMLFGLIKWYERLSERHLGDDIFIETERPIREIYFNGKSIKKFRS